MSRIGKAPVAIPSGVEVKIEGNLVTVKGKLGELKQVVDKDIVCKIENNAVVLARNVETKEMRAKHGLYRALINNMVSGVSKGWEKTLTVEGVGFKTAVQGNKLTMNIGFSHPVEIIAPAGITIGCNTPTEIVVKGIDRTLVGQIAANIRAKRVVEPYHSYGIRYKDEVVVVKEGKTAGK